MKFFIEDHDERRLYRYLVFESVRNPEDCPPHTHNRDHVSRCLQGVVEVTLQAQGQPAVAHVLQQNESVMVPAEAMHSAMALVEGSSMCCQFDHVDDHGQPTTLLGPREAYI